MGPARQAPEFGSPSDVLVAAIQGRFDGLYDAIIYRRLASGEQQREVWRDLTAADVPLLLRTVGT